MFTATTFRGDLNQILCSEMETLTRNLASFLNREVSHHFFSSPHCHKTQVFFLSLFYLVTTANNFLLNRIDFKTPSLFFSNNPSSLHQRQVYAFRVIPEIPYRAAQ